MTLRATRAVAAGFGVVLFGVTAGCGSAGGQADRVSPTASPSPSVSASPSPSASPSAPANVDLGLRLVKVTGHPSCTVAMLPGKVAPNTEFGFAHVVVAFEVVGLPNADGATVSLTRPPEGTESGVLARFNADGSLRDGDGVYLDGAPKVTYYAIPADLRRINRKTVSFTLTVDPYDQIEEPNEKNNALKLRLTVRGVVGEPKLTKGYPSGAGNRCAKVS